MKLPNVASLIALCLVLIPAVQVGIEQVYPAAEWFWSPLIVTALGALAKWLQERRSAKTPETPEAPPSGAMSAMSFGAPAPTEGKPGKWRSLLLG